MYVDTTSYFNAMATGTSTTAETASSDLGKDDFLSLFIAQLENQDPLSPMDDTQTLAQLAQFSSLEQLTNISEALDGVTEALSEMQQVGATSYIGKTVLASGSSIALSDGKATDVTYVVPSDATNVYAHIYDAEGNLVRSVEVGDVAQGQYDFTWDGKDSTGKTCEDDTYYVAFTAEDADGGYVSVSTLVEGTVKGVAMADGDVVLALSDGRYVYLSDVYEVNNPDTTSDTTSDTTADTSDDTADAA